MSQRLITKEVMGKDNFFAAAMRNRYKITKEDDDNTISQKIAGTWRDPNRPIPEGMTPDAEGFIEF